MASVQITCKSSSSLRIEGDFVLKDETGKAFDLAGRTVISICRCGHTKDSPFCDGSHKAAGFQSPIAARALQPPAPRPPSQSG